MATNTIVITYTDADKPTSLTIGGTAYTSLTFADIELGTKLMEGAIKLLRSPSSTPGSALTTKTHEGRGTGRRDANT